MKYFVVADVHGFYDEMLEALKEAGFDNNNPDHTFVSLGDLLDRGEKPLECLKFVNSLNRKILIHGNHEDILSSILRDKSFDDSDIHNGTFSTTLMLARESISNNMSRYWLIDQLIKNTLDVSFANVCEKVSKNREVKKYFKFLIPYFETKHYIFVHGWIPFLYNRITGESFYLDNWRKEATNIDFLYARWATTPKCIDANIFEPNKTIVCGHFGAYIFHQKYGKKKTKKFTPFVSEKFIGLDATTVLSKKVNCYIIED